MSTHHFTKCDEMYAKTDMFEMQIIISQNVLYGSSSQHHQQSMVGRHVNAIHTIRTLEHRRQVTMLSSGLCFKPLFISWKNLKTVCAPERESTASSTIHGHWQTEVNRKMVSINGNFQNRFCAKEMRIEQSESHHLVHHTFLLLWCGMLRALYVGGGLCASHSKVVSTSHSLRVCTTILWMCCAVRCVN